MRLGLLVAVSLVLTSFLGWRVSATSTDFTVVSSLIFSTFLNKKICVNISSSGSSEWRETSNVFVYLSVVNRIRTKKLPN